MLYRENKSRQADSDLIKISRAKSNRGYTSKKGRIEQKPLVNWEEETVSFFCPQCKNPDTIYLPILPLSLLKDPKESLTKSILCKFCRSRNELKTKSPA